MPIEYRFNREKGILYGSMSGELVVEAFADAIAEIVASPEFHPDVSTLWDLRDVDFTTIDRSFEEQLVAIRRRHPERGEARLAFVVDSQLGVGMTRMYEILSDDFPQVSRVFTSYAEAERWLLDS